MANVSASSGASGLGCILEWSLLFDDAANTVTINATHKRTDGALAPDPQQAQITTTLDTNQTVTVDLLTATIQPGGQLFDGDPASMLNSGPRTRTNVKLKVSADRAAVLTFSTQYQPPA